MKLKINQISSQCPQNISAHSTKTKRKQKENKTKITHFSVGEGIKLEVLKIESWNLFLGGLYVVN